VMTATPTTETTARTMETNTEMLILCLQSTDNDS
jgi:hypothetical protein